MYQNLYQKFDRKTDYAKAVVNLHNKRVLLAPDPVSKSTLLLCTINKNEYLSKYYLQFSNFLKNKYKIQVTRRGDRIRTCDPLVPNQVL